MSGDRKIGRKKRKPAQQRYVSSGRKQVNKRRRIAKDDERITRLQARRRARFEQSSEMAA